jgi:hypothetical protein
MVTDKTLEIAMLERANQKLDLEQQITKTGMWLGSIRLAFPAGVPLLVHQTA